MKFAVSIVLITGLLVPSCKPTSNSGAGVKDAGGDADEKSPEDRVRFLYKKFLGREADDDGLSFWSDQMRSGQTFDEVRIGLIRSNECRDIIAASLAAAGKDANPDAVAALQERMISDRTGIADIVASLGGAAAAKPAQTAGSAEAQVAAGKPADGPTVATGVRGVYSIWQLKDPLPPTLSQSGIAGIVLGAEWDDIEGTAEGAFDWSKLDQRVAEASAQNLAVSLNVIPSLMTAPQWLKDNPAVQAIDILFVNPFRPAQNCKIQHVPVYWDPIYQEKRHNLIRAAGQRYANNPSVVSVPVPVVNFKFEEMRIFDRKGNVAECNVKVDQVKQWQDAGYTTDKMFAAAQATFDVVAAAFPTQMLKIAVNPMSGKLDGSDWTLPRRILDDAFGKQPSRVVAGTLGAKANLPEANDPNLAAIPENKFEFVFNVLKPRIPRLILQSAGAASNGPTDKCRQNGGVEPCPVAEVNREYLRRASTYKPIAIEIWGIDAQNAGLAADIKATTAALRQ